MIRVNGIRKREFQQRLVSACGGCVVQHTGWPCGTCFFGAFDSQAQWHAVLVYRGDCEEVKVGSGDQRYHMATGIVFKDDGTFSHHTYTYVSAAEVRANIRKLWEVIQ